MNENKVAESGAAAPAVPGVDVKVYLPKDPDKDHEKLTIGIAAPLNWTLWAR